MKFNFGKIFLPGFGFFGISIIWGVYNAFVPIFLADKFSLSAGSGRGATMLSVLPLFFVLFATSGD
jgi:hypothetical protein